MSRAQWDILRCTKSLFMDAEISSRSSAANSWQRFTAVLVALLKKGSTIGGGEQNLPAIWLGQHSKAQRGFEVSIYCLMVEAGFELFCDGPVRFIITDSLDAWFENGFPGSGRNPPNRTCRAAR